MGQARQRHLKALENGQAPTPAPAQPSVYGLVEGQPIDQRQPDGTIVRLQTFHIVDRDNGIRAVQTPNGPVPFTLVALPIPVGHGLIVPAGPVPKV